MEKSVRRALRQTTLILLLLLAFGLRIHNINEDSFWQDEGLTVERSGYAPAQILRNEIVIQGSVSKDTHPPLYYLLISLTRRLFGESDFSFRYPSLLAGILLLPLLYQLGRRLNGPAVGLAATLFAAINPLYVWYAQEARMYTLLVLWGLAATLLLWLALADARAAAYRIRRLFLLYLLFAALAFLTHYAALFLLLAQLPFWTWILLQRGQKRLLVAGALVGLIVLLPFLPLIVPRLLTGAETGYRYISPLVMLADVVRGFGLGLTVDFSRPAIRWFNLAIVLLLLWGFKGRRSLQRGWWQRLLLLVYLLSVVVGLALGSLLKPMYLTVRHTMIGSPAFFVLLARGLVALPAHPRFLRVLLGVALLSGPLWSLQNLYQDESYSRSDVRALVRYVEKRAGSQDLVLYNNAILLPLHEHYAQREDLRVTALPVYPHPASAATTERLAEMVDERPRVWFIPDPPADGRDAGRAVWGWLEQHWHERERYHAHGPGMYAAVVGYDRGPLPVKHLPEGSHRVELTWPDGLELVAWRPAGRAATAQPTLWLALFWDGVAPEPQTQLRFQLRDVTGNVWLDQSHPFWPSSEPSLAEEVPTRLFYGLSLPVGLPTGEYELLLLPWQDGGADQEPAWRSLGTFSLDGSAAWPFLPRLPVSGSFPLRFENGLQLLGVQVGGEEVRPGHTLPVNLYWQAPALAADVRYDLELVGPRGHVWDRGTASPRPAWLNDWPAGTPVLDKASVSIPAEAPGGQYHLRWRLSDERGSVAARPAWRPWYSEWVAFGTIPVRPWPLETTLPSVEHRVGATFGEAISLYGYDLQPEPVAPGERLSLSLVWQAQARPADNHWVFVHVVAGEEEIVAAANRIPVNWLRPTGGWRPGEVLLDPYQFRLPSDLAPGRYRIYVGFFEPEGGQRLPVTVGGEVQPDGRLLLQTIEVAAPGEVSPASGK